MDLIQQIDTHLNIVRSATSWTKTSLEGEKSKRAYDNIVGIRRRLKKKRFALDGNPAAALYGESQVGKSYLVGSILSEPGKPFGIYDENGTYHNFVADINPAGNGNESTSLVSRFSVNHVPKNPKYPIKGVLLTPADLILVLCDSFYNDIKADRDLRTGREQINADVESISSRFSNHPDVQSFLTEDDVLEIAEYFTINIAKAESVLDSNFFKVIPLIIGKAAPEDWPSIFSLLWNKNAFFTDIFEKLLNAYRDVQFATELDIPVQAVLNRCGTLLDVLRLDELFDAPKNMPIDYKSDTVVLLPSGVETRIEKSYLCALTAELVFGQPESLTATKPFLKHIDLLDFPGARARKVDAEGLVGTKNIPQLLLRGKVAYLFNKYSAAERINILLFCAKHDQSSQRLMPELLNNWVSTVIGKSPDDRQAFISNSKISPLFLIGTWFNVNMKYDPLQDRPGDPTSLTERWNQRYDRSLNELINTENYDWLNNWTTDNRAFQNLYLLRDFEKSENLSHLFTGYHEFKREIREVTVPEYPTFRQDLRQSFIDYPFVRKHFADPAYSWDEAASINKDGTELIIRNLTVVAENISNARTRKLVRELNGIKTELLTELRKYYHSNDKDAELQNAKSAAGNVQLCLDNAFAADGIRNFGIMMQDLMVKESEVLKLFRGVLTDLHHTDLVNRDKYSTFRINVPVAAGDTEETYFSRLCAHYEKVTPEQKDSFRKDLENRQIDLNELISGSDKLIKNNSQQLAEALIQYWLVSVCSEGKTSLQSVLNSEEYPVLQDIRDMYEKLFLKYDVEKRLATSIREYVDGKTKGDLPYEIISDICSEELNNCIRAVGFDYLDGAEIDDLRIANEKNKLGLKIDSDADDTTSTVEDLFTRIDNWSEIISSDPQQMKSLSSYRNYLSWYNRLKIGFVIVCEIPNYDVAANEALGRIIAPANNIQY